MLKKGLFFWSVLLFFTSFSFSQTTKQKQLEKKRIQLQKEIARVNKLLFSTQEKEKDLLSTLENLDRKIKVRANYIKALTNEINYLQSSVIKNEKKIEKLQNELKELKEDYAEMILKSYKSKSEQSKLMFLLSSKDFFQAYKRYRYMQQYAEFRKKQGDSIVTKTLKVEEVTRKLVTQKKAKQVLAEKSKRASKKIIAEKKRQEVLVQKVKFKEKNYVTALRKKQKEERKIEKEIERVIRAAIAASNKTKKSNSNAKPLGFMLTPEGKALANRFEQNRGKLPWPVVEGLVTRNYGVIPHPTLRGIKIDSKGIHITTQKNASARAVFKGTVLQIQTVSGRNAVYIKHGNYISLYNNLDKVYVTTGQQVVLKQTIGTVFTNKITGKTILKFQIWKDTQRQNPEYWLTRM